MEWEINFLTWLSSINQNSSFDWLSNIMKVMSIISELGIVWIALAILFISLKKTRQMGFTLAFGLFAFALFIGSVLIKLIFRQLRPIYVTDDLLTCAEKWISPSGSELFNLWCIPERTSYSFVSTRAFTGFLSATIILFFNRKVGIGAYVLAALVSFSRLYFGLVFPIDTIVGALLGTFFGILTVFLSHKFYQKIIDFFDSLFAPKTKK